MKDKILSAQEGIAHLAIIIVIALFAVGGITTYVVLEQNNQTNSSQDEEFNDEGDEDQDPQTAVDNEDQPINDDGSL